MVDGAPEIEVTSLAYDSRDVTPGALFFCLPGLEADGHSFAPDAVARGAVALLTERPLGLGVPEIVTANARAAMAPIAARLYGDPSAELEVVGITGTNGKTTTAYLLREIMLTAGMPCGMIGTVKNVIGDEELKSKRTTPEAPDLQCDLREMVLVGDRACAMEVSSVGLALHRVDAVHFSAAVLINLTPDHLDFHGSMEAYWGAKRSLFDFVAPERAVINIADERGRALAEELPGATTFAVGEDADVRVLDVLLERDGASFDLCLRTGNDTDRTPVRTTVPGAFNVENALAAAATAHLLGVGADAIAAGLGAAERPPGRLERIDEGQPFEVVVDYAHSPDALERVLTLLREQTDGKLISVFGATGPRFGATRPQLGEIAGRISDHLIVSSDHPGKTDPESVSELMHAAGRRAEQIDRRRPAITRAIELAESGDIVAITGGELPVDDLITARSALKASGYAR